MCQLQNGVSSVVVPGHSQPDASRTSAAVAYSHSRRGPSLDRSWTDDSRQSSSSSASNRVALWRRAGRPPRRTRPRRWRPAPRVEPAGPAPGAEMAALRTTRWSQAAPGRARPDCRARLERPPAPRLRLGSIALLARKASAAACVEQTANSSGPHRSHPHRPPILAPGSRHTASRFLYSQDAMLASFFQRSRSWTDLSKEKQTSSP